MEVTEMRVLLWWLIISYCSTVIKGAVTACYITTWSQYRKGTARFSLEDVDPHVCTHLFYAFANIDDKTLTVTPAEWNDVPTTWDIGNYKRLTNLRKRNPSLKILLSVGGWKSGSKGFTAVVATKVSRQTFVNNAINFLRRHALDGLDLDWEYPGMRGSPREDAGRYCDLLQEMRSAFDANTKSGRHHRNRKRRLLLTTAVPSTKLILQSSVCLQRAASYADYVVTPAYDYHGHWEWFVAHGSPLFAGSDDIGIQSTLNVNWTVSEVVRLVGREKLLLGLPLFAKTHLLEDAKHMTSGAPSQGPGNKGISTGQAGMLAYYEVCKLLKDGWRSFWDRERSVPFAARGQQWVGYEDTRSLMLKGLLARVKGLAGVALWALDLDDFKGTCGQGKYPLVKTVKMALIRAPKRKQQTQLTRRRRSRRDVTDDVESRGNGTSLPVSYNSLRLSPYLGTSRWNRASDGDKRVKGNIVLPQMSAPLTPKVVINTSALPQTETVLKQMSPEPTFRPSTMTPRPVDTTRHTVPIPSSPSTPMSMSVLPQLVDTKSLVHHDFQLTHSVESEVTTGPRRRTFLKSVVALADEFLKVVKTLIVGEVTGLAGGTVTPHDLPEVESSPSKHNRMKRSIDVPRKNCSFPTSIVADPADCRYYYQCSGHKLYHFFCGPGAVFDPEVRTCISPNTLEKCVGVSTAIEEPKDGDGYVCEKDGYYRDMRDCNKFYRCADKIRHFFSCPDGLVFREDSSSCDFPRAVGDCARRKAPSGKQVTGGKKKKGWEQEKRSSKGSKRVRLVGGRSGKGVHYQKGQMGKISEEPLWIQEEANGEGAEELVGRRVVYGDGESLEQKEKADRQASNPNGISETETIGDAGDGIGVHNWRLVQVERKDGALREDESPDGSMHQPLAEPTRSSTVEPADAGMHKQALEIGDQIYRPLVHGQAIPSRQDGFIVEKKEHQPMRSRPMTIAQGTKARLETEMELEQAHNVEPLLIEDPDMDLQAMDSGTMEDPYEQWTPSFVAGRGRMSIIRTSTGADPFACPRNGYFRDPKDCRKFYHCANGLPYHVTCIGGLVFNHIKGICDWPQRVPACDSVYLAPPYLAMDLEPTDWSSTDSTLSTPQVVETIHEPSSQNVPREGGGGAGDIRWSHGEGAMEARSEMMRRSRQRNAGLPPVIPWYTPWELLRAEANGSLPAGPLLAPTPEGPSFIECEPPGFRPDPDDCRIFYICSTDGTEHKFRCAEELVFNILKGYCEPPSRVPGCRTNKRRTMSTAKANHNQRRHLVPPPPTTAPTTTTTRGTPQGTTHSNSHHGHNQVEPPATPTNQSEDPCTTGMRRAHPFDCGNYFVCGENGEDGEEGVWWLTSCPPGRVYNPTSGHCDSPTAVPACRYIRLRRDVTLEKQDDITLRMNHKFETVFPTGNYESTIGDPFISAAEPMLKEGASCDPMEEHLVPDPTHCAYYYKCVSGTYLLMRCKHGLAFQPELKICDWAETVLSCKAERANDDRNGSLPMNQDIHKTLHEDRGMDGGLAINEDAHKTLSEDGAIKDGAAQFLSSWEFRNGSLSAALSEDLKRAVSQNSHEDVVHHLSQSLERMDDGKAQSMFMWDVHGDEFTGKMSERADDKGNGWTQNERAPATMAGLAGFRCAFDGLFSHPYDCNLLFECAGSTQRVLKCPGGLVFNTKLQMCDHIQNVPDCLNYQVEAPQFEAPPMLYEFHTRVNPFYTPGGTTESDNGNRKFESGSDMRNENVETDASNMKGGNVESVFGPDVDSHGWNYDGVEMNKFNSMQKDIEAQYVEQENAWNGLGPDQFNKHGSGWHNKMKERGDYYDGRKFGLAEREKYTFYEPKSSTIPNEDDEPVRKGFPGRPDNPLDISDSRPYGPDSHPTRASGHLSTPNSDPVWPNSHPTMKSSHPTRSSSHPSRLDSHPTRADGRWISPEARIPDHQSRSSIPGSHLAQPTRRIPEQGRTHSREYTRSPNSGSRPPVGTVNSLKQDRHQFREPHPMKGSDSYPARSHAGTMNRLANRNSGVIPGRLAPTEEVWNEEGELISGSIDNLSNTNFHRPNSEESELAAKHAGKSSHYGDVVNPLASHPAPSYSSPASFRHYIHGQFGQSRGSLPPYYRHPEPKNAVFNLDLDVEPENLRFNAISSGSRNMYQDQRTETMPEMMRPPAVEQNLGGLPQVRVSPSRLFTCSRPGLFTDPEDCQSFFECSSDLEVTHMACPGLLVYNEHSGFCDQPINVPECYDGNVEYDVTSHSGRQQHPLDSPNDINPDLQPVDLIKRDHHGSDNFRVGTPCIPGHPVADRHDCSRYYHCITGGLQITYCPTGLVYNRHKYRCDDPRWTPECQPSHGQTTPAALPHDKPLPQGPLPQMEPPLSSPPYAQLPYAEVLHVEFPQPTQVHAKPVHHKGPNEGFAHVPLPEAKGLFVNESHEELPFVELPRIEHPKVEPIYGAPHQPTAPETVAQPGEYADVAFSKEAEVLEAKKLKAFTTLTPRRAGYGIRCHESGYIRDVDDCSIFYYCNGPVLYEFQCAAGLAFDPEQLRCEWPDKVPGCERAPRMYA